MKENRLVYEDAVPSAAPGQGIDPEQAKKVLDAAAKIPALQKDAVEARKALDDATALKAQQDRENLKKELESRVGEKEKIYADISVALKEKSFSIPEKNSPDFFGVLKKSIVKEVPLEIVIDEGVLKAVSLAAAVDTAKANGLLVDIFAEEVALKVQQMTDLDGKRSFKVKYENKDFVVELSDQDASVAAKAAEATTPEQQEEARLLAERNKAKAELLKKQSLVAVLGFFGLIPEKDGKPDYDAAVDSPVVKFVGWLFGAEFAKGAIDPLVKAASARWPGFGEKVEGWRKELQGVGDSFGLSSKPQSIDSFLGDIRPEWGKDEEGILSDISLANSEIVLPGKELIIDIPEFATVDFKQRFTLNNMDGTSREVNGKVEVPKGGLQLKAVSGKEIPAGTVFGKGVKVWLEYVVEEKVADKSAPAPTDAAEKEAPKEEPAA